MGACNIGFWLIYSAPQHVFGMLGCNIFPGFVADFAKEKPDSASPAINLREGAFHIGCWLHILLRACLLGISRPNSLALQ
jgi:hypothetical protein